MRIEREGVHVKWKVQLTTLDLNLDLDPQPTDCLYRAGDGRRRPTTDHRSIDPFANK